MYARSSVPYRHLWAVENLSSADIRELLDTARRLRAAMRDSQAGTPLRGRNLALLNDAAPAEGAGSLRHAAVGLGAQVSHLRPSEARLSAADAATARLLGRLYDAIDCEDMPAALVAEVAREAGVPVFNGLGGARHPTRVLAELLAIQERSGKALDTLSLRFVGDPGSACGAALLRAAAACGIELRIAAPRDRWPPPELWEALKAGAVARGGRLHLFESAAQAGEDSDVTLDGAGDPPWPFTARGAAPRADECDEPDERSSYREAALQAMLVAAIS
ncbi:hypothetical protein [Piscinibacter sp.]|uniref:hypothetical protein n=1 Tax=Piscinibacter sp. TaxID=1903157 RepID=UPI0039E4385C